MPLDVPPAWGQVNGFGLHECEMEWAQPPDWWQMMLIAFGGVVTVNGTPAPFRPGSLIVVPPSARCRIERTSGADISQHWIKFRPDPDGKMLVAVPQVKSLGGEYAHFDMEVRAGLDFLAFCRVRLDVMAWSLLWAVSENAAVVPEDPVVGQVEQLIKSNLDQQMTAESLAKEAGVSVERLTRLFREQHGQSPVEYIRTLRMQRACALLVNTSRPIKEIATRVGFADLQRFNKIIRETFGCSPRMLRTERPAASLHVIASEDQYRLGALLGAEPPAHLHPDSWDEASGE